MAKELTKEKEVEFARQLLDRVYASAEDLTDVVYDDMDPELEYGDALCERLNMSTVCEILALGFKAKYGKDWRTHVGPHTPEEWCAHCTTPGCPRHPQRVGAANDMPTPGRENEL